MTYKVKNIRSIFLGRILASLLFVKRFNHTIDILEIYLVMYLLYLKKYFLKSSYILSPMQFETKMYSKSLYISAEITNL